MKLRHLLAAPLAFVCITSALAQDLPKPTPTGFLSDYALLSPSLTSDANFHSYTTPSALGRPLGRVYIQPLTSYPEDAQFNYIDRATLAALASKFDAALNANLTGKIILVPTPDQADTVVQMAVTAVAAVEPNRGVVDYLPIRLITKPIKDAAMGKQQEVVVTMEMKMRDAKSDQVIYESLATTTGKTMGRSGDQVLRADMKTLDPVIEAWTEKVAQSLTKLQPGVAMVN